MITAYVGVGTNTDKRKHVEAAIAELSLLGESIRISPIYECQSIGFDGEAFYNFVIEVNTTFTMLEFHQNLREIEHRWGRDEDAKKFQSRCLDLDLILFGDVVSEDNPQLPRHDIYIYPFVIQPLYDLNPELIIPNKNDNVRSIWQKAKDLELLTVIEPWFEHT